MEGVALNPRVLVLELAQLGSLASALRSKKVTNRSLQHRIAMQVHVLIIMIIATYSKVPFPAVAKRYNKTNEKTTEEMY